MTLFKVGLLKKILARNKKSAKILLYHSVNPSESIYTSGLNVTVTPSIFDSHLSYLSNNYDVVSLDKIVSLTKNGDDLTNKVALTFDDGFMDNYTYAFPMLKKYKLPATIFLVGESINNNKIFWVHKVQALFNSIPKNRIIDNVNKLFFFEKRINNLDELRYKLLFMKDINIRLKLIEDLVASFGLSSLFKNSSLYLNSEQINEMQESGIAFGCHGQTHSVIGMMDDNHIKKELEENRKLIKKIIKKEIIDFAYPFGEKKHYSERSEVVIRQLGFKNIFLADGNFVNDEDTSISRIKVENEYPYRFLARIENISIRKLLKLV